MSFFLLTLFRSFANIVKLVQRRVHEIEPGQVVRFWHHIYHNVYKYLDQHLV